MRKSVFAMLFASVFAVMAMTSAFAGSSDAPNPRFKDNLNGTVTDNLTGLIWLKNADCWGLVYSFDPEKISSWKVVKKKVNDLANGECGLTDGSTAGQWRVPTTEELGNLMDYLTSLPNSPSIYKRDFNGKLLPEVDRSLPSGHPFNKVLNPGEGYWADGGAEYPNGAWLQYKYGAGTRPGYKSDADCVWPVR